MKNQDLENSVATEEKPRVTAVKVSREEMKNAVGGRGRAFLNVQTLKFGSRGQAWANFADVSGI